MTDVDGYIDLGSPYAYLALERFARVVPGATLILRPVLLGAIFAQRGYGSWALTPQRAPRIAEIEARAKLYGLPLAWPEAWPPDGLTAMRACVWADRHHQLDAFARAVLRARFGRGEATDDVAALSALAGAAGLPGSELGDAVASDPIKNALRAATAAAWERGVRGVPTFAVGDVLVYGDDQLEQVPALLAA